MDYNRSNLLKCAVAFLSTFLCFRGYAAEGVKSNVAKRILEVDRNDRTELDALTASLRKQGRRAISNVVKLWMTGDDDVRRKSGYILARLGDAAVGPLLEAGSRTDTLRQAWRLRRIAEDHRPSQRAVVVKELRNQLENRAIISHPVHVPGPQPEESPPIDPRICDQVYIQLRQMLNSRERWDELSVFETEFYRREPKMRDLVIEKYRKLGTWVDFRFLESGSEAVRSDDANNLPSRPPTLSR